MSARIEGLLIGETLGQGGFGTVYRAKDETHGREVAVKILLTSTDEATRRRFDRERRAMGALSTNPNIVTVYTSGYTDESRPYLVMELVGGGTLAERIEAGPMTWDEVRPVGIGLIDAVEAGHKAGVVHRDIKPGNVLLTEEGKALLTDFGIAAVSNDNSQRVTVSATPAYAAPEILQGRDGDERSDMYSLAATLFACLNGSQPYGDSGDGMLGVLSRIVNDPVPELSGGTQTPPFVVNALRSAMAKDAADRPETMAAFRSAFLGLDPEAANDAEVVQGQGLAGDDLRPAESDVGASKSSTSRVRAAVGLVALVAAAGIAIAARALSQDSIETVDVPAIIGLGVPEAAAELELVGLIAGPVGPVCDSAIVTGSSPEQGESAESDSSISLDVDPCVVPDFVGLRLDAAIELILTIEGMTISWPNYCDDVVLSQSPLAGTAVAFDSNVEIELTPCG